MFRWDKCAMETLAILENLVAPGFSVGAPIVSGG